VPSISAPFFLSPLFRAENRIPYGVRRGLAQKFIARGVIFSPRYRQKH
jgi:hypothetical protein